MTIPGQCSARSHHWVRASALLVIAIFAFALGCSSNDLSFDVIQSSLSRIEAPSVSAPSLQELARGNSLFAIDVYHHLAATYSGQNLFFSPYSISVALAMTYAGAEGNTESQMAATLRFALPEQNLHAAFNEVNRQLESRGQGAAGRDGEGFRLNVVNSIWGQKDYPFVDTFLDCLALNYGAGLRAVDFVQAPEECRTTINSWVEEQTEDRIKDLLAPGSVHLLTRMVLVNAVYFNAAWENPFEESVTRPGDFRRLAGSTVRVDMMRQTENFAYVDGDGFKAVSLPYDGNELAMLIVVPNQGHFSSFEASMTSTQINEIVAGLSIQNVALTMPKWGLETPAISLAGMLRRMGMPDAFDPRKADFSGMTAVNEPLFISDVVHKAFVAVDEKGTEAAAATGVILGTTSMPPPPIELDVDRPFVYFIRDVTTDTVIFMGRVTDPS